MSSVDFRKLSKRLDQMADIKDQIMPKALDTFKQNTPKRSGNARRQTRLDNNKDIVANYGYAGPLDQGSSRRSPQGMTKPTIKKMQQLATQYLKRLGA